MFVDGRVGLFKHNIYSAILILILLLLGKPEPKRAGDDVGNMEIDWGKGGESH
jgi:hypothetical protein